MVAKEGSLEQLKACGLHTVADQMRLRKLIHGQMKDFAVSSCKKDITCTVPPKFPGRKLTKAELNELQSPEDRRVYIMK